MAIDDVQPMCFILSTQQLCEFSKYCDKNSKTRPTTEEAFGDTGETADEALKWYERVVEGKVGGGSKKRKDRGF